MARPARHRLGVLGIGRSAEIGSGGTVVLEDVVLRWWIGAGARWYQPEVEVAVRQERRHGTPVVLTSLHIPGGDVRVETYATLVEGIDWVVIDLVNDSRIPVTVALVCEPRPTRPTERPEAMPVPVPRRWRIDGAVLRLDDGVCAVAARPADAWCAGNDLDEVVARLEAGDAPLFDPAGAQRAAADDRPVIAQLFAVSHATGIRLLARPAHGSATAGATDPATVAPAAAPAAEAVANGWRRQLLAGCRFELGEDQTVEDALTCRSELLLDTTSAAPGDVQALAAFGHREEAARRLAAGLEALRPPLEAHEATPWLVAAAQLVRWSGDDGELVSALAEPAVQLAGWVPKRGPLAPVRDWALAALVPVEPGPRGWWHRHRPARQHTAGEGDELPEVLRDALRQRSGAAACSAWLLDLRRRLVDDDRPGEIALLPGWQPGWRGRPVDVHGLPTAAGVLSYAIRWHGERPALLWELIDVADGDADRTDREHPDRARHSGDRGADGAPGPTLTCPALDGRFQATERVGEALLAAPGGGAGS